MALFCDASCLVKFTRKQGAHIIKYAPYNYNFNGQEEFITSCAFPELFDQADSIYVFSIARANCFTWSFVSNFEQYSVVLISHHILGDAFIKFLHDSRQRLKEKSPTEIFDQIWFYVTSWTFNSKTSILTVITPAFEFESESLRKNYPQTNSIFSSKKKQKGIFEVLLDNTIVVYSDFDPSIWIGSNDEYDYLKIWHALMTGKCILIVNDDPSSVSNAVFSIISLANPFMYCEEYLSFTRIGDPRFAEIINGSTRWKIVGTTNSLAAERCNQFSIIINLSKNSPQRSISSTASQALSIFSLPSKIANIRQAASFKSFFSQSFSKSSNDERKSIKRLTVKLMQKLEDILNDILTINPYSDFLQIPITKEDVAPYFHKHTSVIFSSKASSAKISSKGDNSNIPKDCNNNENDNNDDIDTTISNDENSNCNDDNNNNDNDNNNNNNNDNDNNNNDNNQKKKIQKQLSISEVIEFSKSQTFGTWRYNIACRGAFRDAMLSETPEDAVNWCSLDDLRCVLNVIPFIRERYERDAHICAVLHRHEKIANKRIKLLTQSETDQTNTNEK